MTKLNKRVLSALLALVLFVTNFPVVGSAVENSDDSSFSISFGGEIVSAVEFDEHERITVTAENIPGTSCQWQIQIPGTEQWVNIHGQTSDTLVLSRAVVGSLMVDGSAYVRCAAISTGKEIAHTPALHTTVKKQESVFAAPAEPTVGNTEVTTEATEPPAETAEAVTEAAEPAVEAAEAVTEAAEPAVEAADAVTEAAEPAVEAADAVTEATEPAVETAEAVTEATEPPAETAEAVTEATEPPAETAEAVTEAAEPAVEAADAVTEATKPAVEAATESSVETTEATESQAEPVERSAQAIDEKPVETLVDRIVQLIGPKANAGSDAGSTEASDFVTVTIHYRAVTRDDKFEKTGMDAREKENAVTAESAADPDISRIFKGTNLNITIPCHVMPGYQLVLPSYYDSKTGLTVSGNTLQVNLKAVSEDMDFYVYYKEEEVSYTARYFLQNVYDDLYTEDTTILTDAIQENMKGYPGDDPKEEIIYPQVYGFTALFFQPDTIASDGSTVFEVYYDRNYYLMNFDMDGGFGTAPVYARYGTSFTISPPTKPGHTFDGWTETKRDKNTDGSDTPDEAYISALKACIDDIPETANGRVTKVPFSNLTYKANWTVQQTSYTVAYWIADGNSKTFIGSRTEKADSDSQVSGKNDLSTVAICGKEEHTHIDSCLGCKEAEHTHHTKHTRDCYSYVSSWGDKVGSNTSDGYVIANANQHHEDTSDTYLYVIWTDSALWPKILIDGEYYTVRIDGQQTISEKRLNDITEGEYLAEGSYYSYHTQKYKLRPDCNLTICDTDCAIPEHVHTDPCYSCGLAEHTHENCTSKSANYLIYLDEQTDKNVTVKGDGSTVVNVVYREKLYTLRFYYARSKQNNGNTVYSVVGGSTNYFGAWKDYSSKTVEELLSNVPESEWGNVKAMPTLNDNSKNKYVLGETTPDGSAYTYYYLEFTAPYGSQLENIWPVAVFNPVEVSAPTSQCPDLKHAYFSAWNGEYKVKYTQDHKSSESKNETIKGLYMYLDEDIVFDKSFEEIPHEDTQKNETYLVNFLGFWDNGANIGWSKPKEFHYHIMIPTTDTTEVEGKEYKNYNGVKYEVNKEFVVYDNSDLTAIENQTAVAIEGYTHIGTVTENANYDTDYKNGKLQSVDYYFYYTRNGPYILNFWNHSQYMVDGEGELFYYGASLSKFQLSDNNKFMTEGYSYEGKQYGPYYPPTLEPGAYTFMGWYTTAECLEGTKVNWTTMTMPDSNLTVYAKWEPIKYNTHFYMDYDRYTKGVAYKTVEGIPHGTKMVLPSDFNPIPTFEDENGIKNSEYRFVGWFYIDDDGTKKAFNPSEMAVRKELHLFAEWTTRSVQEYQVLYAHGQYDEETGKYVSASPPFQMAKETTGYALEATTKTFTAKPKAQLTQFPAGSNSELWLPHTNSHSIVMRAPDDPTEENPNPENPNTYTFYYVMKDSVNYTVKYLDAATGAPLIEAKEYTVKYAVVTETFQYIKDYIPDAFHKRLILSANEEENVITFYYTKDEVIDSGDAGGGTGSVPETKHARYLVVHHYPAVPNDPDSEDYEYEEQGLGEVGKTVTVPESGREGFEFDEEATEEATKEANASVQQTADGKWTVSGVVTTGEDANNKPLILHLHYKRATYAYKVEHRDWETKEIIKVNEKDLNAVFESTVSATSKEIVGYDVYAPDENSTSKTLTLKISNHQDQNVITFYYIRKKVTIHYLPVCTNKDLTEGFGGVSNPLDYNKAEPDGSQAAAAPGFHFKGWYTDWGTEKEKQVWAEATWKPTVNTGTGIYEYTYYAVFEPITLTISHIHMEPGDSAVYEVVQGNTVVSRVMLTGEKDSVTLYAIPAGTYTVREVSSWTWTYNDPDTANQPVEVAAEIEAKVSFDYAQRHVSPCWLHSETRKP